MVVDDPVGGPIGIGVAEWLAATGRPVTLVSPDPVAGTLLSRTGDLADANVRLQRAGVARQLRARITAVGGDSNSGLEQGVEVWTGESFRLPARLLVDCGHRLADDDLYGALGDPTIVRVGDCVAPRTVHEAVLEGRRAALALLGTPASPLPIGVRQMSGAGQYRQLFTPLRVGPLTLANRIVFSAHLTNYATEDGRPSEQHAAYYAARAAGGAGLIITEEHSTHPTDWPYEKLIHGFHPEVIPGYRRITEAVHAHGVPILAQINHNGGQASSMYTRLPVWAPSPVPDPLFREVPKAVEPHEIAEIVDGYARVAGHCMAGGFDGVELQCSHSSIVRGFLSPATNHRTDGYGGALPQRARLLLELVAAVREAIGPAAALGVRLCGDELIEGGTTIEDAVEVARLVEATGHVDYINTSIGVATASLYMIEASMQVPPGYAMFIPSAIRSAVRLPVVGVGRFKDPLQADRALPGRPVRPGGRGPGPDRRRRLRGQGPVRPRRRHPDLPVVQPGVRRPHGAQPLAGVHRESADRAGGCCVAVRAGCRRPGGGAGRRGSFPGVAGGRRRGRPGGVAGRGDGDRAGSPGRPVRA